MDSKDWSRRHLIAGGLSALAVDSSLSGSQRVRLTAGEVIERIKKAVDVPWRTETVDKLVAGDTEMPVKGIATTMMATLNVLERCAEKGRNLVISHETPFYLHQDKTEDLVSDRTFQYKIEFIKKHEMAVFHFHDHWHARHPDGIATGMAQALGWDKNADPQNPRKFLFERVTLEQFCKDIASQLGIRTMRVVGDPQLAVQRVLASWGYVSRMPGIPQFAQADVDVFIAGETREWELVEYAQDSITMGNKKALILLGHVASEEGGMSYCAQWLRTFIPEAPIEFVPAREPFWNADHPVA